MQKKVDNSMTEYARVCRSRKKYEKNEKKYACTQKFVRRKHNCAKFMREVCKTYAEIIFKKVFKKFPKVYNKKKMVYSREPAASDRSNGLEVFQNLHEKR